MNGATQIYVFYKEVCVLTKLPKLHTILNLKRLCYVEVFAISHVNYRETPLYYHAPKKKNKLLDITQIWNLAIKVIFLRIKCIKVQSLFCFDRLSINALKRFSYSRSYIKQCIPIC